MRETPQALSTSFRAAVGNKSVQFPCRRRRKHERPPRRPADEEKKKLWDTYGSNRCDGLANSLKKDTNKTTGYWYVYPVPKAYRGTHSFYAKVWDIKAGKQVKQ